MSIKLSEDEQAGFDVLRDAMPEDLAIDVVKHRRRKKAHITARIARTLVKEYKAYGDVEKAAEIHLARGWVAFEAEWVKPKTRGFHDSNNPMPRPAAVTSAHHYATREEFLAASIAKANRSFQ